MACLLCSSPTESAWNLGEIYQSAFVKKDDKLPNKVGLHLVQCTKCDLVQLKDIVDLDSAYRQYWYMSSLNSTMLSALKEVVTDITTKIEFKESDVVIDIGCNDGSLFKFYPEYVYKIGVDPALNLKSRAEKACNEFINDYFTASVISRKAKVITAIAMFYDLPNPHNFLEDIKKCLEDDGIFVIQMTDLYSMFSINAFDNICHEHLEYYSLEVLSKLLLQHDLEIFDLSYNAVNGASLRVFVGRKGQRVPNYTVNFAFEWEKEYFAYDGFPCFKKRVDGFKEKIISYLKEKKTFVLGASTKGNTLLQYYEIDHNLVPYAAEVNKDKFGLYTIGTNIEIISEEEALAKSPESFLVLPWHFKGKLVSVFKDFIDKGGELLFPLPVPCVVNKDGERMI